MQVVVTDGEIQVYMDAVDLGSCGCAALPFPEVGSCSYITDASPCNEDPYCQSCITDFGIEVDGQRLAPTRSGGDDPWTRFYGSFPSGQLSLALAGCGHPLTRISLDGPAYLQTTATADYVNGVPHVSWTTNTPPLTTLATLWDSLSGEICNVQSAADYTFSGWVHGYAAAVQPLGSRMVVDTDFGTATIWRAGTASATFPPAP